MRRRAVLPLAILVALAGAGAADAATVTVAPGDTLGAVAARAGVSVGALAAANGISDPNRVVAGRVLVVPGAGAPAAAATVTHRVRAGETLSGIAARAGVSARTLARLNGIADPNRLAVGRVLRLPAGVVPGSGAAGPATTTVRVAAGETLSSIAARAGVSPDVLTRMNGIADPNVVAAGTLLRVPAGASGPTREQVAALLATHSARYGVDPALVRAIAWQESGWWQGARSSVGAIGVMQLMPGTASWLGSVVGRTIDPTQASDNVEGGVAYLAWLLRHTSSTTTAIGAYYQGLASVRRRGMLPETKRYVASVLALVGRV